MQKIFKLIIHFRAMICYIISRKNKKVYEIVKCQCAANYINKKYIKKYDFKKYKDKIINKNEKIIWIYWKQGVENAPKIVQYCINRTKNYFKKYGYTINILDSTNISEYIDFPDYISIKHDKKIISEAHFSDLIRLQLLSQYGGCWIDSTVFLSDIEKEVPKYLESDFFVYKSSYKENDYVNSSNWIISSSKDNPIINATRDILFEYWKNENEAIQYYFFHIIFKIVCDNYENVWNNVPTYLNIYPHLLQKQLNKEYDERIINNILENSRIHKLRYKNIDYDNKENVISKILLDKIK